MNFNKNDDLKNFHAPWYERVHPFWLALSIVLAYIGLGSLGWWVR